MNDPRDLDLLKELAKRIPVAVLGFLLFVIGAAGQVPIFNFPVTESVWKNSSGILGAGLMIWQAYLLWDAQRLGGSPLPISKHVIGNAKKITLLSSKTQTTELIARTDGLELNFEDFQNPSISVRRLISISELKQAIQNHKILVTQSPTKGPKYGRVQVASLKRWLYQTERHPSQDKLQEQILNLVKDIISQEIQ